MILSSLVISVAMEMVLPGLAGWYWIDRRLGTKFVFLVLGLVLGVVGGMIHLIRLVSPKNPVSGKKPGGRGASPRDSC